VKVLIVVPLAIVVGFWVAGSPAQQRDVRNDERRVEHLQTIQYHIVEEFWLNKNRLPTALAELEDDISGFDVPVDPVTRDPYEYRRLGPLSFELCATFALERTGDPRVAKPLGETDSWDHGAGRACFERTIDPERYRLLRETTPVVR
jgi:hypothetical protein